MSYKNYKRLNSQDFFIKLVKLTAKRSTCPRRQVGACIVKNGRVISLGYNGPPSKVEHECLNNGICLIGEEDVGDGLDRCPATHAEQNAIINAARNLVSTDNGIMYCTTKPCIHCLKLIVNAGIKKVYYIDEYKEDSLYKKIVKESKIKLIKAND